MTLPDDTDCFEELKPRPLREAKNTVNEYNLTRFTFLPVESAISIDMMHMMHNLFDHFVPFLLGKSIDLMEKETAPDAVERLFSHYNMEKKVLLNDILQQGRVKRNTQFSRFIYQINVLASPLLKTFLVTESTQPKAKFFPSSRIHHCFRAKTQPFQRSRIRYSRKHIATFIQQKTAFRRKIVLSHKLLHQHGLKILGFVVIAACE